MSETREFNEQIFNAVLNTLDTNEKAPDGVKALDMLENGNDKLKIVLYVLVNHGFLHLVFSQAVSPHLLLTRVTDKGKELLQLMRTEDAELPEQLGIEFTRVLLDVETNLELLQVPVECDESVVN